MGLLKIQDWTMWIGIRVQLIHLQNNRRLRAKKTFIEKMRAWTSLKTNKLSSTPSMFRIPRVSHNFQAKYTKGLKREFDNKNQKWNQQVYRQLSTMKICMACTLRKVASSNKVSRIYRSKKTDWILLQVVVKLDFLK